MSLELDAKKYNRLVESRSSAAPDTHTTSEVTRVHLLTAVHL